ncbi:glycoside hydrolase family 26 protein [Gephyromycinifex aptenodytis]|uniref:glycoside hydrolase family 26 protein n=1 Tax=Gephyromycinifex aptenodytis TaxID=2716227 RepID=UPI0014489FA9|nr:glycosyl hydrolase [Gephyromycinifex aptenodytis]
MSVRRRARSSVVVVATLALAGLLGACSAPATPPEPSASTTSTPTPTQGPPGHGMSSGLKWDSGVFTHDADYSKAFAQMRQAPLDVLGVAPTRDSWQQIHGTWWLSPSTIPEGFTGKLNVAVPLFPEDGSMEEAAAGNYNEQWIKLGQLIAERYPDSYVRPGWEMNINNWHWSANPDNVEQFKQAFRHAAQSLRKGGPELRIVFNVNEGKGNSLPDATMAYPGDDVVDIIGIDAYDWNPPYNEATWQKHKTQPGGWDFWGQFARDHGKMFSVPEWGVIAGSPDSGGDNPAYITAVMGWMRDNADIMAFDTYFDEREEYCRCSLSQNPKAQQAYQEHLKNWWTKPEAAASSSK